MQYLSDTRDILFNLLDVLKVTQHERYGLDDSSVKEILGEFDKFVESEIFPTRQASDEQGVKLTEQGVVVPEILQNVHKAYHEMGWFALGHPEDIEGSPVPEALRIACDNLGIGGNMAWMMYPGLSRGALNVIRMKGDEYAKSTFIPPMMSGEWGGTMCLTEAGAGSDVGNLKTTAKPIEGKEGWFHIQGSKIFISSGESDLYKNNIHLVLARTPKGGPGTKGISLFIVPRFKVNADGSLGDANDVRASSIEHKMGIHASATCVMNFGDNNACEGYLIGEELDGMATMFIMMNEARLLVGGQGEASANLAYLMAQKYAHERVQFKKPIVEHPDVRRTLLRTRAMARGLRALMLYTGDLFDHALNDPEKEKWVSFLVPICKAFCSDEGFQVTVDAMQVYGGYGYCSEYGAEQFVRDSKIASIYEGTNAIQALDFVNRKILMDQGKILGEVTHLITQSVGQLSDEFKAEQEIFQNALASAKTAMDFIGAHAQKKEINIVLQSASEFLSLCSHVVVAWRLLDSALIAKDKLASCSAEEEKQFLQSKIDDFRIYCRQYLVLTGSKAQSICQLDLDISTLAI